MGYSTDFTGRLEFDRVLTVPEYRELEDLADYGLQDEEFKKYADTHPQSYLQWQPTKDGKGLEWNGGEKFYDYVEWLEWLIEYYFRPKEITVNGQIKWSGEDVEDNGIITVENNVVSTQELQAVGIVECPHCGERFVPNE